MPARGSDSRRQGQIALASLVLILLLALFLRLAPWGHNRFLEDEALYSYWGLQIASGADPLLDEEPVDKPPLFPYTLALGFLLFPSPPGATALQETVARLPSLFTSLLSIALTYALGRALFDDDRVGLITALLLALSPFDILFASTAFTDPLLTTFVLAALLAVARDRWGLGGLFSGLALATKQQALFFLPLIVLIGALSHPRRGRTPVPGHGLARLWAWPGVRFGLGLAPIVAGIFWWDLSRLQRPGFLEQSLISYGGLEMVTPRLLLARAADWLRLVGAFWSSPWLNLLLGGAVISWFVGGSLTTHIPSPSKIDWSLLLFVAAFLLLHWLVSFQVWDRYLLGLLPLVALLAARALVSLGRAITAPRWRRRYALITSLALALAFVGPVVRASQSDLPLGGDHGAYDGIEQIATYMRTEAPPGSVLYHHWLGYHHRFYLHGADLRLHWYPDLDDLVHDATVYRREPRYIAFPSWRDAGPVIQALSEAGIELTPVLETSRRDGSTSFRLYRLEGP